MSSIATDKLQQNIASFIDFISQQEDDPPKTRIIEAEMNRGKDSEFSREYQTNEKFVKHPSKIYHKYRGETISYFVDLVEKEGGSARGFKIQQRAQTFGQLAWKVMDYEGDFTYSDSSYQSVSEDTSLQDRQQPHQYTLLVPLVNFIGNFNLVELYNNEKNVPPGDHNPFPTDTIQISELSDEELSAILTYEGYPAGATSGIHPDPLTFSLPSYCLKIKFQSNRYASFGFQTFGQDPDMVSTPLTDRANEIANRVSTTLRLYDSDTSPSVGLPYIVYRDWRTRRKNINSVDVHRHFFDGYSPTLSDPRYQGTNLEIKEENVDNLAIFWEKYGNLINRKEGYGEAVHRFNQMFQGSAKRDDLVDAAIGYESLFTTGVEWGSIATTIALHGSILLHSRNSYSRKDLWDFFKAVYNARSEIVHSGKEWEDIVNDDRYEFSIVDDEHPSLQDATSKSREILAQSILSYMDHFSDYGYSVGRVNKKMFEQIRETGYIPEE